MTLLNQISSRKNLDVAVVLRHKGDDQLVIEASITEFKESEGKASVVKKITVLGVGETFDEAQDAALNKAMSLLGGSDV